MKKNYYFCYNVILLTFVCLVNCISNSFSQTGFTVDHTCSNLNDIPDYWIEKAKSDLHITYNHTSHGSQLTTGMNALRDYPEFGDKYSWVDDSQGDDQNLSMDDSGIPGAPNDLSQGDHDYDNNGIDDWADDTYDFLDNSDNYYVNVVLWSWCNIAGHDISRYLHSMDWLIGNFSEGGSHPRAADHPVKFVFITAHANGGGEGDSSDTPNEEIRAHVAANSSRILFDFSDLENYNPDNEYFLNKLLADDLSYDSDNNGSRDANWGVEYIAVHDDSELDRLTTGDNVSGYSGCGSCAHSNTGGNNEARLNCVLKGRAVWYLFARLAGWDGNTTSAAIDWSVPLSVKLENGLPVLTWSVSNIGQNDKLILEHSNDERQFLPLKDIDLKNINHSTITFRFVDPAPYPGTNYYRVLHIDDEGLSDYSNTVFIKYKDNNIRIYPNPFYQKINIDAFSKQDMEIFTIYGKKIKHFTLMPGKNIIDLQALSSGLYYIKRSDNKIWKIYKILK